jgi:hypothetical protein
MNSKTWICDQFLVFIYCNPSAMLNHCRSIVNGHLCKKSLSIGTDFLLYWSPSMDHDNITNELQYIRLHMCKLLQICNQVVTRLWSSTQADIRMCSHWNKFLSSCCTRLMMVTDLLLFPVPLRVKGCRKGGYILHWKLDNSMFQNWEVVRRCKVHYKNLEFVNAKASHIWSNFLSGNTVTSPDPLSWGPPSK